MRAETADIASQAQAIRHLVAAAVPGMAVARVTVLSSDGTLLASGDDAGGVGAAGGRANALARDLNRSLEDSVRRTLAPYLGLDNFQVSVNARINTDRRVVNETIFDPDSRVERSIRIVRESENAQNLSRQRPTTVEQNIPDQQVAADGGEQSSEEAERREELTNFEISSRQVQIQSDGFAVEALSVALVVNRARLVDALGGDPSPEAIADELREIEGLVASAAGISAARGDTVRVTAVNFLDGGVDMAPVPAPSLKDLLIAQGGNVLNAVTILVIALALVWFGLKPAMAAILDRPKPAIEASSASSLADGTGADGELTPAISDASAQAQAQLARLEAQNLLPPTTVSSIAIKRLEQIVIHHEEQAALILKQWMHDEEAA